MMRLICAHTGGVSLFLAWHKKASGNTAGLAGFLWNYLYEQARIKGGREMSLWELFVIAVGLAMVACAVSACIGLSVE